MLLDFFEGREPRLLEWLAAGLLERLDLPLFQRTLFETDLDVLTRFYSFGPRRNRRFRSRFALGEALIEKERLDDYLVLSPEPAPETDE